MTGKAPHSWVYKVEQAYRRRPKRVRARGSNWWWLLSLSCGHRVLRYRPWVNPEFHHVHCEYCRAEALGGERTMGYGFGGINDYVHKTHEYAKRQGFWDQIETDGDPFVDNVDVVLSKLALIMKELGGAVQAVRLEDRAKLSEELADSCIRIFDLAEACGVNLEQGIVNKMQSNEERPRMHGRKA